MALISFQKQFAGMVKDGTKRQTIRKHRRREISVGDTLHLYTGLRTRDATLLGVVKCKSVWKTAIYNGRVYLEGPGGFGHFLRSSGQLKNFATDDGFKDWEEMAGWFKKTHKLPFHGNLITW